MPGFPEMGAPGAALASTIVRYGAFAAMLAVILSQRDAVGAGVRGHWETFWGPGGWRAGWQMRRLGLSAGLSNGFETVGFAMMSLYAAELGRLALDAYSISHNLLSTVFMVGLGLAVATGVRVGIETGRGNASEAAFAGWCGLGTAIALMGVLAGLVVLLREEIALLYTNDPELVAHTAALFLFSACVFVPDSAQVVMGQAVRALGDAWVAIGIYAVCFLIMLVPLGWWLVYRAGADESALLLAIMAVCLLATLLLAWRFPGSDARWGAGGASHMSAGYPSQKDWWGMRAGEWLLFGMAYCFKLTTLWVNLWWLAPHRRPAGCVADPVSARPTASDRGEPGAGLPGRVGGVAAGGDARGGGSFPASLRRVCTFTPVRPRHAASFRGPGGARRDPRL